MTTIEGRAHIVNILISIDIVSICSIYFLKHNRLSTHATEGAHRRLTPPGIKLRASAILAASSQTYKLLAD